MQKKKVFEVVPQPRVPFFRRSETHQASRQKHASNSLSKFDNKGLASGNTSFWNQFGDDKNIQTLIQTCRVWK
jgi:hypothetical protein